MREKKYQRPAAVFLLLGLLFAALAFFSIQWGSVSLSGEEICRALSGKGQNETSYHIIWDIRLPRMLAAAVLGGALSVSGFLLQTFFANPIAGPFVLGISSGANLTITLTMVVLLENGIGMDSASMILAAFAGSMISMGFVLLVSMRIKQMSALVICGIMVSYICSAVTDFLVTFADESEIVNLRSWSMGSFSGISWDNVQAIAAVALPALALTFLLSKPMGAYQLGEAYAKSAGVDVRKFGICLILLSSILSACVTAFAGPVSFVGIAAPHIVKKLLGTAKPLLVIPGCFFGGAAFCLACDLIARTVFAPVELGISSVTAVFGAPVVIWIMVRGKGRSQK